MTFDPLFIVSNAPGEIRIGIDGEDPSLPEAADVTQASGFSTGDGFAATSNFNPALDVGSLVVMFKCRQPTASTTRLFTKNSGGSVGYAVNVVSSGTGRVQVKYGANVANAEYAFQPEDYGKTLGLIYVKNLTTAQLWMIRSGEAATAVLLKTEVSGGAAVPGTAGVAIGGYQTGTSGTLAQPFEDEVIACGYGNAFMTPEQIQTLGLAMVAQGTIPTDGSYVGGVSVYQASGPGGLGIDQLGSNDIAPKGSVTYETVTPSWAGKLITFDATTRGQSNANGDQPYTDFAAFLEDYTATFAACRFATLGVPDQDLRSSNSAQGTAGEVYFGRAAVANDDINPLLMKFDYHGSSIADWLPGTGTKQLTGAGPRFVQLVTLLDQIDTSGAVTGGLVEIRVRSLFIDQGEAEVSAGATEAAAHEAATEVGIDSFITLIGQMGQYWSVDPNFRAVLRLMSPTIQTARDATLMGVVRAGQIALAASRSDILTIDPDPNGVVDDGVHFRAASLLGFGKSWYDAIPTDSNQVMVEVA